MDYGSHEDLVLLGVRNRHTGEDWEAGPVDALAEAYGFALPRRYVGQDIDQLQEEASRADASLEGWVCRFADGTRYKIKGAGYLEVQRLLTGLSPRQVLEAMEAGTLEKWLPWVPEELMPEVLGWRDMILHALATRRAEIDRIFAAAPQDDRKAFALWVTANHPDLARFLFARLNNHPVEPFLFRALSKEMGVFQGEGEEGLT